MYRNIVNGGLFGSRIQYSRKDRWMTTIERLLKKYLLLPFFVWATFDTSSKPRGCFGCFFLSLIKKINYRYLFIYGKNGKSLIL